MTKEEIKNILPHRDHMLLLDDVENMDGTAVGHYKVRGDEFFLSYPIRTMQLHSTDSKREPLSVRALSTTE